MAGSFSTHDPDDVDSSKWAFHHRLGKKSNQAASGNHNHDSAYSKLNHTHASDSITGKQIIPRTIYTSDASGQITIPHALGVVPSAVFWQTTTGGTAAAGTSTYLYQAGLATTTQVVFSVRDLSGNLLVSTNCAGMVELYA